MRRKQRRPAVGRSTRGMGQKQTASQPILSPEERQAIRDARERMQLERWLERGVREMFPKVADSAVMMSLLPEGDVDAKMCLELGAAVYYDKPIIAVAVGGRPVPIGLRRIAHRVIECEDLEAPGAHERLMEAIEDADKEARLREADAR